MVLDGLRVLDLSRGIAGPYCTKLLADAGAEVVMVEPAAGHPERRRSPALFDFLHTSKQSVGLAVGRRLAPAADVMVVDGLPPSWATPGLRHQVLTTLSPFGTDGPWAGRPATDFTLQAWAGSTGSRGLPGREPIAAAGQLGEWLAGTYAAVGTLAAWLEAARSGQGDRVDVAIFDCMAVCMVNFPSVFADFATACGQTPMLAARRSVEVPSIEPTADGWVTFTTNSAQQFSDLMLMVGRPELAEDDRFRRAGPRFEHRHEFWEIIRSFTRHRTTSEVLQAAGLLRIPAAPVLHGASVDAFEQFAARGVFVAHPSGRFRQPRVPYRLSDNPTRPFGPVPHPRQHDQSVEWDARPRRAADGWRLPLEGIRVVDLTAWWAGPCATHLLGCLGADVVKVESARRPDMMRFASTLTPPAPQWWEWGPMAHGVNTNKRGITLDLNHPAGRELLLRLVATADLLVENYTPRVMEQFALDWPTIHRANPRLSMVRMPSFGLDGPWRDRPGFAQTMESLSGMAWLTGFADGPPVLVRGAGDPLAGLHAAFGALLAMAARRATGRGQLVEATMVEAALNATAEQAITYQLTGRLLERRGNRSLGGAVPHGLYRCRGDDTWLALAVTTDRQWRALVEVLEDEGVPAPATLPDPASMTARARARNEEEIDRWVEKLAGRTGPGPLADRLAAAGVPAAEVIVPATVRQNPQLRHRRLFEVEAHPVTGEHPVPGLPLRMGQVASWLRRPSPTLGQHNDEVLEELGCGAAARADLRAQGVIAETLAAGR